MTMHRKNQYSKLVRENIPVYPNWPKDNVNFINTVELCNDPVAFNLSIDWYKSIAANSDTDAIFAVDSRGFIWASPLANQLSIPMHVVRKAGKLPGKKFSMTYDLEYGTDTIEIIEPKKKIVGNVLIVDDVLATGGTAQAVCKLLNTYLNIPYQSMTVAVLVNLTYLSGKEKMSKLGVNVLSLIDE